MSDRDKRELHDRIVDGVKSAVSHALEEHRKAGRSVPVLREGKVVRVVPEPAREMVLRDRPKDK